MLVVAGFEMKRVIDRPHQIDQLAVHDADQLLRGIERIEDLLAHRIGTDALDKIFGHVVADIGLEQGLLNQFQPIAHVRFRQFPLAAQAAQGVGKAGLNGFEHGNRQRTNYRRRVNDQRCGVVYRETPNRTAASGRLAIGFRLQFAAFGNAC